MKKRFISGCLILAMLFAMTAINVSAEEVQVDVFQINENFNSSSSLPSTFDGKGSITTTITNEGGTHGNVVTAYGSSGSYLQMTNPAPESKVINYIEYSIRTTGAMEVYMYRKDNTGINPTLIRFTEPVGGVGEIHLINKRYGSSNETTEVISSYVPGRWYKVEYRIDFRPSGSGANDKIKARVTDETTGSTTEYTKEVYTRTTDFIIANHCFLLTDDSTQFAIDDFKIYHKETVYVGDNTPVVSIVNPASTAFVGEGDNVDISVQATVGGDTISKVELYEDGVTSAIGTVTSLQNNIANFTVEDIAVGTHSYYAKAYGAKGGYASSESLMVVANEQFNPEKDYLMFSADFEGIDSLPSGWKTQNGATAVVSNGSVTVSGESGGRLRFDNPDVRENKITTVEYRIKPNGNMFVWMVSPINSGINPNLLGFEGSKVITYNKRYGSSNETTKDVIAFVPGHWYSVRYTIDFKKSGSLTNDKLIVTVTDETAGTVSEAVSVLTRNTEQGVHNHTFELISDTSFVLDDVKVYEKGAGPSYPIPTIEIIRPANNATAEVGMDMDISAAVSVTNDTISKVEFYELGVNEPIGTVTQVSGGVASHYIFGITKGIHQYYAKVYASKGGEATSEIITVMAGVVIPVFDTPDYVLGAADFDGISSLPANWKTQNSATATVKDGAVTVTGSSGARLRFDCPTDMVAKKSITVIEYRIRPDGDMFVWMVRPDNSGINPNLVKFNGSKVQSVDKRYSSSEEKYKDLVAFVPGHWYTVKCVIDFRTSNGSTADKLLVRITDETTNEACEYVQSSTRNTNDGVYNQIFELSEDTSFVLDDFRLYNATNRIGDYDKNSKSVLVNARTPNTYTLIFADYEGGKLSDTYVLAKSFDYGEEIITTPEDFTLDTGDKIFMIENEATLRPLSPVWTVE